MLTLISKAYWRGYLSRRGCTGGVAGRGTDIEIADAAADFTNSVVGLLRDSKRRELMASAGREKIVASYGPSALRRSMEVALSHLEVNDLVNTKVRAL